MLCQLAIYMYTQQDKTRQDKQHLPMFAVDVVLCLTGSTNRKPSTNSPPTIAKLPTHRDTKNSMHGEDPFLLPAIFNLLHVPSGMVGLCVLTQFKLTLATIRTSSSVGYTLIKQSVC